MDLLTKLNLTSELDQIANQIAAGDLGLMDRIEKVRRIDEIIALLTGGQEQTSTQDTLAKLVKKNKYWVFVYDRNMSLSVVYVIMYQLA